MGNLCNGLILKHPSKMGSPKLIVFDLDYTLWPFWVDTHVIPPFEMSSDGNVYDSYGQKIRYYEEVPAVLKRLKENGYLLGVASRTGELEGAEQLLKLFNWNKYFTYKEIYPGCKIKHFQRLQEKSGIPYSDMMFFDDEGRNIYDVKKLGVTCIRVENGITQNLVDAALNKTADK